MTYKQQGMFTAPLIAEDTTYDVWVPKSIDRSLSSGKPSSPSGAKMELNLQKITPRTFFDIIFITALWGLIPKSSLG